MTNPSELIDPFATPAETLADTAALEEVIKELQERLKEEESSREKSTIRVRRTSSSFATDITAMTEYLKALRKYLETAGKRGIDTFPVDQNIKRAVAWIERRMDKEEEDE